MTAPKSQFPFSEYRRPRIVSDDEPMDEESPVMPDPDAQTAEQCGEALGRLDWDIAGFPRFPWDGLDDVAGRMAPGEFWIVAARTGNGKTLFLLNLFDDLVQTQAVSTFYIGLEQTPAEMRTKWACTVLGLPMAGALGGKWPFGWTALQIQDARNRIKAEIERQSTRDLRALGRFCAARFINAAKLREWTAWAVDHGAQCIVVDHLNRIARDADRHAFDGHSHVVTTAKELAVEHQIVMLAASQVGRPNGDPLQKFMPPALHELRGGGTSEEEANTVLMVYRPLKEGITKQQMTDARTGRLEESALYEPNLMAVRVVKHRLLGLQKDQTVILRVEHGRIVNRY